MLTKCKILWFVTLDIFLEFLKSIQDKKCFEYFQGRYIFVQFIQIRFKKMFICRNFCSTNVLNCFKILLYRVQCKYILKIVNVI